MRALVSVALVLGSAFSSPCPPQYELHQGIGCVRSLYYEVDDSLDNLLPKSRTECGKDGAHLPMIKSNLEDDAYSKFVNARLDERGVFIVLDLVCNATSRRMDWADGTAVDYTPINMVAFDGSNVDSLDFDCVTTKYTATSQPLQNRWAIVQTAVQHEYTVMCVIDCPGCVTVIPSTPRMTSCPPPYQMQQGIGCIKSLDYDIIDTLDHLLPKTRLQCAKDGAHLPIIKSKEEDGIYGQLVMSQPDPSSVFIALDIICNETSRRLEWIDGSSFDYIPDNVDYDDPSIHDLDFDCVSKKDNVVAQPSYNRWRVIASTGRDWSITVMCVLDCPYCASTPSPTRLPSTTLGTPVTSPAVKTSIRPSTPVPTPTEDYCTCNPSKVYLDIVFVVDTSDDMTSNAVKDATATIKSTLYGLTFGTGRYQSNVAALAFAEKTQTVRNFGDFKSSKDISSFTLPYLGGNSNDMANAIKQASSMVKSSGRDFTRGVIVLFTNSFDQRKASNINDAANAFKDNGGIFITLDYSKGSVNAGLEKLASPGYFVNDTSLSNPDLDADLLYAFCDANCFCKEDLLSHSAANPGGREVANGGCYRVADFSAVYEAAKDNCESDNGFVATVHDDDKNFFLLSLFPPKARYWLGLKKIVGSYQWADGVNDPYTYWSSGNPVVGQDCVYSQQQSGFNTKCFSAPCADPLKNSMAYACQFRPCSSEYDCNA